MGNSACEECASPVEERPGSVAEGAASRLRNVPDTYEPLGLEAPLAAANVAMPAGESTGEPRPANRSRQEGTKLQRTLSFVGGILIGISLALPVLAIDGGEGGGMLVLAISLALAATGIGMHVRGANRTGGGELHWR